ncbi:hypothetical protein HID58_052499, partial [Brassica napus]
AQYRTERLESISSEESWPAKTTTKKFRGISKRRKKMIYRKWSLLSGPPVILGGAVVAAVAVGILVQNVTKGEQKKNVSSNK